MRPVRFHGTLAAGLAAAENEEARPSGATFALFLRHYRHARLVLGESGLHAVLPPLGLGGGDAVVHLDSSICTRPDRTTPSRVPSCTRKNFCSRYGGVVGDLRSLLMIPARLSNDTGPRRNSTHELAESLPLSKIVPVTELKVCLQLLQRQLHEAVLVSAESDDAF